ncbi:hypothetical protein [Salmonella phage SD-2_S15]|nr:hypothetical protein [Salmonella phage SD-2_S15]
MCWFIIFKRIRFFILSFYLLKVFCLLFYLYLCLFYFYQVQREYYIVLGVD